MSQYDALIENLKIRAEIRLKATCRGKDDRIAKLLIEAAEAIQDLEDMLIEKGEWDD